MTSSALTGNTSGLASATSPGLVGITTQTFAGDKTLTGLTTASGGIINTGLTGANATAVSTPGSGKVGEKITWASAPATQSLTATVADWTNANIVLSAGVWLIQANVTCNYATGALVSNEGSANIEITDTSNVRIQNMAKQISVKTVSAVTNSSIMVIPFSFVAVVSSSTTYKLRISKSDASGTGSGNAYNQSGAYSEFFAVRIA